MTAEEIKEFAAKYDPQPFHLDEAAAEKTFFKGLAASGWMTAAITMRLRVESIHVAGGMIGAGVDEIKFDRSRCGRGTGCAPRQRFCRARRSTSRPEIGVVKSVTLVFNQRDELVMRSVVNFLAPVRPMRGRG